MTLKSGGQNETQNLIRSDFTKVIWSNFYLNYQTKILVIYTSETRSSNVNILATLLHGSLRK